MTTSYRVHSRNACPEPSGRIGFTVAVRNSSKLVKEKEKEKQSLNRQDNGVVRPKPPSSRNSQPLAGRVRAGDDGDDDDDELVRYMSNLPGYLQRAERSENFQDKALNVGVLDWGRLESWKCNQKGLLPVGVGSNAYLLSRRTIRSSNSTFTSPPHSQIISTESKLHPSTSRRNLRSSQNDGISRAVKSSFREAGPFQDVDNCASVRHFDGHDRPLRSYRSFDRCRLETGSEKGKQRVLDHSRMPIDLRGNHPSNSNYHRLPLGPRDRVGSCDGEARLRIDGIQGLDIKRKALKQTSTTRMGASSSELKSYGASVSSKEKKNADNRMKKRMELQEPAIDVPHQHRADESKNIVLLLPLKSNQTSSPVKQPRISVDDDVTEATESMLSEGFSDKEFFSSELHYEVPHSCPLPSKAENDTEQQEMAPDAIKTRAAEWSSSAISRDESSNQNLIETSKFRDQETTELSARKGRHPSQNHRFSFSLGRMTRSFSFKESSAIPQLSSTYVSVKSGPVTSKASAGLDNSSVEKANLHNRARSSPLRRILDPLLKSKGLNPSNSARIDQSSRSSLNSYSYKPVNATESLQNDNHEPSSIQAQLILTRSNGFPLFRFVINNKNIIVAAPLKNLSGKNDQGCNYVMYAIDEIKRKGGSWINQVGKEKSCGFVYNVVGQMKICSSPVLEMHGRNSNNQYMVKECVLFGVEQRQAGQASGELMPSTELAAVVIKRSCGILGFDSLLSDKEMEKGFPWSMPGNEFSSSCTVILPGGMHSLPSTSTGVPSPLIHRWRSGGSCDCGGWDVGCKLRILSNENKHQKTPRSSGAYLMSDDFELFIQGEPQLDKPKFSMALMEKGKYMVEFSSSISLLQAFFICISVVSCQKLSDLNEVSNAYEEKVIQEHGNANGGLKKIRTTVVGGDAPAKYASCPPVSPVGRV